MRVIDSDGHFHEPFYLFDEYTEKEYWSKRPRVVKIQDHPIEEGRWLVEGWGEEPYLLPDTARDPMEYIQAGRFPEAANAKPDYFIESRFIKELEESGFIARLYGK